MRRKSVLCVLVTILSLWACNEENSEISAGLLGNDIPVVSNVESSISTRYSLIDNLSKTDKLTTAFLGTLKDDDFGTTSAACAMQLRIASNVFIKDPENLVIDSVYLDMKFDLKTSIYDSLKYKTMTLPVQNIKVYSLLKSISDKSSFVDIDDSYMSLIGNGTFDYTKPETVAYYMRYHDAVGNRTYDVKSFMRVKLDNAFGEQLISGAEGDYVSNEAFVNKFHGIVIAPESNTAGVGLFNFAPSSTVLTVHYRNGASEKRDSLFIPFGVNNNSVKIAKYDHVHTSDITESIKTENQDKEASKLYVQGGSGLKAMIHLPQSMLDAIKEEALDRQLRDVNKAEIILPVILPKDASGEDLKFLNIPEKLVMVGFNKDNEIVALSDYIANVSFFNGIYNKKNKEYRFNIAYLLQYFIDNNEDDFYKKTKIDLSKGLAIYPNNRRENPRRVILDGESIKFDVTYTDLKNN